MRILYLLDYYLIEYPLLSEHLLLLLVHGLEGFYHALVQAGDFHVILEFPIDKHQGIHCRLDINNWEVDLKQNINELGER